MKKNSHTVVALNLTFSELNNQTDIAVGLSGGGDSMALTHMLCRWAQDHGKTIHALTVDHNLRDNSAVEAQAVARYVADFPCLKHTILKWNFDEKPDTAIMEQARQSRYALMADYCNAHNIQTLCVAHHADDQAETFLFRLSKGSGLDGLVGMKRVSDKDGLTIFRPLLDVTHQDLIAYCQDHKLQWVEDPSNQNTDYARPRMRKALEEEGWNNGRLSKTLSRLNADKDAIDWMVEQAYATCVQDNDIRFDIVQTYPHAIQVRILSQILVKTGETSNGYPPKLERVEEIVQTIQKGQSATLYGCMITCSKDGKTLAIRRSKA